MDALKAQEFRRGWPVLLAGTLGIGIGLSGLLPYNSGLFIGDLNKAIGLSNTQFGFAFFLATVAMGLSAPAVGWAVDRFGVRWPAIGGVLGLSLSFLALGSLPLTVERFTFLMIMTGFLGAASTSVGYTRAINSWFDKGRGLALGLAQSGAGLSGAILPIMVVSIMQAYGWQYGYLFLALVAAAMIPVILLFLRERPNTNSSEQDKGPGQLGKVLKQRVFWLQMIGFSLMLNAVLGLVIHLVPMLTELGLSRSLAARYAGLTGLAVIGSRILVGWLADVVHAPFIAMAACLICAFGCLMLGFGGAAFVPFIVVALGVATGAEIDLVSYLTVRYFGLGVYGRTYALQYSAIAIAGGLSPMWVGAVVDWAGNYRLVLVISALLTSISAVIFLRLPRYGASVSAEPERRPEAGVC